MKNKFIFVIILGAVLLPSVGFAQTPESAAIVESDSESRIDTRAKNFFGHLYTTVDTWRENQEGIWREIKSEKEQEIATREAAMDQAKADRVDRVLEGDQTSMYNGGFNGFDWHILLLKLYNFALFIFTVIFSSRLLFFGILVLIIGAILIKIYDKIRHPRGF